MNFYQEISLMATPDIGIYFIWQKVYQQVHIALVENKNPDNTSTVGVSFPDYDALEFSLGKRMHLIAEDEQLLKTVQCKKWLNRLIDYASISDIKSVPEEIKGYSCFRHVKLKGNKEKLARRRAKRKGESFEQALAHLNGYEEKQSKLPFVNMVSQSNGNSFRLYIEKLEMDIPQPGSYSCYGLSSKSSVPVF